MGAEGGTWSANDSGGRTVVLKYVPANRRVMVARVFDLLRGSTSPHLPAALELVDDPEGGFWLVSQYIEGESLGAGPVPLPQALAEALGVAHALATIHALGTHHGDVSANNVIVTPTKGVVLTDLGQLGSLGSGTPGFLAPEVLAGAGGPSADRFGVGSLLCLRLFGEVPWRKPDELVSLDRAGVRRRLDTLAAQASIEVPGPLAALLARLLDPQPEHRVSDPDLLVARLRQLHQASQAGQLPRAHGAWWIPQRWAFVGDREPLAQARTAIARGEVGLVVVEAPPGSGRGRVVEELIASLQLERTRGGDLPAAGLGDADLLSRELGRMRADQANDWLEAWVAGGPHSQAPRVWGASEALPWPERLAASPELQAAVLRAGANLGRDVLVLPVEPELAERLEGSERVLRLEVRPWLHAQIEACLREVVEAGSAADHELLRWAQAIHEASGGWPARVIRAIEAFARSGGEDPDRAAIERALRAEGGGRLDPELARRVLDRHWGFALELPASLVSEEQRPLAGALAAARASLGDATLRGLARATLDQVRREGKVAPASLALDADDAAAIEASEIDPLAELGSDLVAWLERGGIIRVGPRLRLRALRDRIRRGQAEQALAMLVQIRATGAPSPAESLEEVRALEQLGRANEALAAVERVLERATGPDRDRALGLRWRALVDVGQAAVARDEAEDWARTARDSPAPPSWRRAVAWLWGGLAQLYAGGDAVSWLAAALAECEGEHGPATGRAVASVRARVFQLEANLAHLEGDAARASDRYRAAAEAFGRAGESLGRLVAEGSLAALAVHAGEFEEALTRGRRTLRAFLARAHVQTLPAACFNSSRALVSVGALDEGRRLHALTREVVLVSGEASPLARARLRRSALELELAAANFAGRSLARRDRLRRELARGLAECAEELEAAGALNEAADAVLIAAACLRVCGDRTGAQTMLEHARTLAETGEPELGVRVGLALEALAQARRGELAQASTLLASVPGPSALWARGERLLALTYDRTLLCALHAHGSIGDASTGSVASRLLTHLEDIMAKVPPLDRRALRQSLLSEAGEAAPLRELVRELELASAEAERPAPSAAANQGAELEPAEEASEVPARRSEARIEPRSEAETARTQQLLRLFRRLARHQHLDELLEQVVEAMMELTEAERGVVCVGRGDEQLQVAREFAAEGEGVTFSRSIIERVLREGEPVLSVDAASDDRFDGSRSISHLNLRSVLAVPLIFRGEVLGAAYVDHRLRRGNFDAADLSSMEDFAALAALAVTQARSLAEVRSQAEALERQKAELAELLEQREADLVNLREEVRADPERRIYRGMVGSSKAMQGVFRLVDRLADSNVPVVIYGESGTGKELVARAIHSAGIRAEQPFVGENCGAIPETLLESVLFGHARGAFTGAQSARPGLFEAADKGTIFLDEIGETSPAMQTKLLRVLQEGEIRRLGETKARKVDVRVIAASNRDLEAMVERGDFRQDLYYRINVVKLSLPPLRERREDVPALIDHFLERHRRGEEGLQISASALRKLTRYPWPGNVRELENEVQRWGALCEDRVMPEDLSPAIEGSLAEVDDPDDLELRPRVDRLERELIARAMKRTEGNQTQAAQLLGLSRYGLQKKLKRMQGED